jgi:glycosyltransferase involved in cell wall biosynthesis
LSEDSISRQPLVSIITVSFNAAAHIRQTIESVLNQMYPNIEYIIIDGGSTDGTVEIIREYAHRLAYWVSEPDEGIYDAWNKAIAQAKGDWITFLGADDVFCEKITVEAVVDYLNANQINNLKTDIVHGNMYIIKHGIQRVIGKPWHWHSFKTHMNIAHPGSLHSKYLFEQVGHFNPIYKISGDYELLLRKGIGLRTVYTNMPTVRMGADGKSSTNIIETLLESYQAQKNTAKLRYPYPEFNFLLTYFKYEVRRLVGVLYSWK